MFQRLTIKDRIRETQIFNHRLIVSAIIVILLTLILLSRFVYLQIMQHQYYSTLSKKNEIDLLPYPPHRGLIYDRHGKLLAKNIPVFSLMVTPSKVTNLKQQLKNIKKIIPLSAEDINQFNKQIQEHQRFEQVPLKLKLTEKEVAKFSLDKFRFPGFTLNVQLLRQYPFSNSIAHVVGYVGRINAQDLARVNSSNYASTNFIGKTGIERFYEKALHGTVGYQKVEIDARGNIIRKLATTNPVRGIDLYLTIDTALQNAAEKALADNLGAVVAIKPTTGEVLALVSKPSFNPNLFVRGISNHDFQKLLKDKAHPLYNRTIHGLYAPGSTIKPFIALTGLNSDKVTPQFQIFDPGWYRIPHTSHVFHDWMWKRGGHGWTNLSKAIRESVDTYFFDLAYKIGIQTIDKTLRQFGFSEKTGIDLPNELSGVIPSPAWKLRYRGKSWYPGDTAQTGIGQGYVLTTPLQLAVATTVLANRGILYYPHLLYSARFPDGTVSIQHPIQKQLVKLKKQNYWHVVIKAMSEVTTRGTGLSFGKTPYSVAAKTGTAQVVHHNLNTPQRLLPKRLRNNSVFIAFAPVKHPEIAIAVVVENSHDAPRVARKVLDYYLLKEHRLNAAAPSNYKNKNKTP